MKKYLIIAFAALMMCSCNWDKEEEKNGHVVISIYNWSNYDLVLSDIKYRNDNRLNIENNITIEPYEHHWQGLYHIGHYEAEDLTPVSMTIEWNGHSIYIDENSTLKNNPCKAESWFDGFIRADGGWQFSITVYAETLEEWFKTDSEQ